MSYIGKVPVAGIFEKQLLSADSSTTSFALNFTVGSESALVVSVGGVLQEPGVAYTLSGGGTNIVFTAAPTSGDRVYVHFLGQAVVQNLLDVNGAEFILDADQDTTLTADTDDQIDIKISGADDFQFTANTFTSLSGSTIKTNTIAETTSASGVTIDGLLLKDSKISTANSIDSDAYIDGSIDTAHIADDQVTLAKMAGLARGKIIYGNSSGNPTALTVGSSGQALVSDGTDISWGSGGAISSYTNSTNNRVLTSVDSSTVNSEANLTFDGTTLAVTGTVEPAGDTSTGDNAAIGYTSAEGLILTGQGSTNDVTIKNDADADVIKIPTGTTNVTVVGDLTVTGDDLFMATNTSGAVLVADGTNYNPVVMSGDATISTAGALTIANNSVEAAMMADNSIDSDDYVDGSIDLAHMSSESVDEDNLYISNSGSNGQFLSKQSGNNGGLTWASAALAGIDDQTSSNDDQLTITDSAIIVNEDSDDLDFRIEGNANAHQFFVDGGLGYCAIASDSAAGTRSLAGNESAGLQVRGSSAASSRIMIANHTADAVGPGLSFLKSRNTSSGSFTIVADNDILGTINFYADDGTNNDHAAASIFARVNGTPGANDLPGELVFATTADGANSATERVIISQAGHLTPAASDTYDLGTSGLIWRDIYTGDLNLTNESKENGNDIDGTKGSWKIQEGADDLFIMNKVSGKKYRFKLEEIK